MKVVLAIKYLHRKYGGAERMVCHTANVLVEAGHDVTISCFEGEGPEILFDLASEVKVVNSDIVPSAINGYIEEVSKSTDEKIRRDESLRDAFESWSSSNRRYSLRWASSIMLEEPQAVIAFLPHTYIPLLYALSPHVPVVASFQNSPDREISVFCGSEQTESKVSLFTHFLSKAHSTVVLLPEFKAVVSAFYKGSVFVRPNFVDLEAPIRVPSPRPRIIAAGRLAPVKDFAVAVEAMSHVTRTFPKALLSIFGDGQEKDSLIRTIRELWLQHNVVLGGVTQFLPAMMSQNAICVMPSLVEGFGLVALEAMAVGLPVIAFSDCDALRYLLEESGAGILVRERSPAALGTTMTALLNDEALRAEMSVRAKSFANNFTREGYRRGFHEIVLAAKSGL